MSSQVYVIVLNWNGWQDAIECLESVFRNDYPSYTVVVCDNGSQDGSLDYIKMWADGLLDVFVPSANPLRRLSHPPVAKAIPYVEYPREAAENGGAADAEAPLVLIETGSNLGFAGGNNVGLRYVLARDDGDYVWLLNNDTVIRPDALSRLVLHAGKDFRIGSLGSTILYYDRPEVISAAGGGTVRKYLGDISHLLMGRPVNDIKQGEVSLSLDYIVGASCFLPINIIKEIGLLDESFSPIYWEDVDWGLRMLKAGKRISYEPASLVYHKEFASAGGKSPTVDYNGLRNTIIYYRKHFGRLAPGISLLRLLLMAINRISRNQVARIPILFRALYDGLVTPIGKLP